jgi:hypothetical protein
VATDSSVPPAARVSAARALLECSIGHYDPARVDARITVDGPEVESLAARLEALARAHNANGDDSGVSRTAFENRAGVASLRLIG